MPGVGDHFASILAPFKETLTIIHREETSQNDYEEPVFSETTEEVQGVFQVIKAENPQKDHGIEVSRQANVFLQLGTQVGLNDQITSLKYPGVRWSVMGLPYQSNLQMEVMVQEVSP